MYLNDNDLIARFEAIYNKNPNLFTIKEAEDIPKAAKEWFKYTKGNPGALEEYFERMPNGKFKYSFVERFYRDLIEQMS